MFTEKIHKKGLLLGLIAAGIILFLFSSSPVHALSFPSGITNYVALNISNSQTTATPNPFQQMISVTSADNGWSYINNTGNHFGQNVEFFYANGTIIPSWLESYSSSDAIWWVKVGSISASSTLTIYMGFANKTTNLFNNKTTGEAPQLSSTYGEYDNGDNVFAVYQAWGGLSSIPSKWSISGSATITYNSNGITIAGPSDYALNTPLPSTGSYIFYASVNVGTSNGGLAGIGFSSANSYMPDGTFGYLYQASANGENAPYIWNNGNEVSGTLQSAAATNYNGVFSQIGTSSSSLTGFGQSISNSNSFTQPQYASIIANSETTYNVYLTYVTVYPPNGVMPSVTFGSVQQVPVITLYLNGVSNANVTITYGTESNFTTVISPNTYYISLYVNGTKVVSLTQGKAVYLKTLAAGLYKITAATNASGVNNQTYYEKINKATPTLSATVNSKALGSYILRDANLSLNGTVSPNILTAKFYDNGKLLGSSPQKILYNFSTLGNNVIVFNTSGNQNYSAASITSTINLTSNQFTIQDTAQNSSEISKFNLTVSNSTTSKSYKNIAYNTTILYSELPQGTDTFNFSNTAYNWTAVSQVNSIFTTTNTTVTAKQWEWIYFDAKVSQTGLALTNYTFNLSDTNLFKYTANVSSQVKLSLQKLYSGTATVTITKTGYNTTIDKISFTSLSPSANTYTITVSEAALTIYVYDMNNLNAFANATITIENGTATKTFTNTTLPFFKTSNDIPIGNDTIIVTRSYPSSKDWTTSDYYATLTEHSAINLSTYVFNASYAVTSTFQVQGPYGQLEPNAIVYLESNSAPLKILEECKTLGSGQCSMQAVDYTSYVYYAALPFTDQISPVSPILTSASGSGGICPTGIWCSYLSVTLLPVSSIPNLNITFTPQSSFLAANENVTYTVSFSTTQNDINEIVDNYSVIINGTLVSSKLYTFSGNPTKGEIKFTQTTPNASYSGEIIENVTISQSTGVSYTQFIYYIQGSGPVSINNPTITNSITGIITGIGPAGAAVFFFIVFIGVTILVWIISGGAVLPTMLIDDAIMGLFAYMGVFTSVIGSYGSYFGWGLFGVFSLWTVGYQLSKIGGMG